MTCRGGSTIGNRPYSQGEHILKVPHPGENTPSLFVIPTDSDEGVRLERICDRPKGND